MKKRLLCILLTLCLATLSACAGSGETGESASDMTNTGDATGSTEQSASDNTAGSEASDGIVEPIIEAQYTISEVLSDFSEDRAWISYRDNDELYYGIIDPNGFLIYSIPVASLTEWTGKINATEFVDGISCLYSGYEEYPIDGREGPGMIVIDKDGVQIFNSLEIADGKQYYYMGYGDDTVLAAEYYADFYENTCNVCEIDLNGEIISRTAVSPEYAGSVWSDYTYYGEGIFVGGIGILRFNGGQRYEESFAVYNRNTHCFFESRDDSYGSEFRYHGLCLHTDFSDGYAIGSNGDRGVLKCYQITSANLASTDNWNNFDSSSALIGEFEADCIAEGLINDRTGIYDYSGHLVASYPENWNISWVEGFSNGYAAVGVKGADGNDYVVTVDKSGNSQYDPIKYDQYVSSWHGYVVLQIDGQEGVYDLSGRQVSKAEYELLKSKESFNNTKTLARSEDNASFFDENGNILSTVYVVSNYDEVSGQIYHMQNPDSASDNTTTGSKDYITLSNFSIEGKWKNVGTYTFGQVQSGAIVAFDGTNCNFFSPKDTYAFYQDGDDYKLECTSLLSTDTLTFTVKIMDENNIDVFNGSNCLEMTRVE